MVIAVYLEDYALFMFYLEDYASRECKYAESTSNIQCFICINQYYQ